MTAPSVPLTYNGFPDLLSDGLAMALADLQACAARPELYHINMSTWHAPIGSEGEQCWVCLAGVVMAQTMKIPPTESAEPYQFTARTCDRLLALNEIRSGRCHMAASYWFTARWIEDHPHWATNPFPQLRPAPGYQEDPAAFLAWGLEIVRALRQVGL